MHAQSLDAWRHEHIFLGAHHGRNERRSWVVVALCAATMAAEIAGGWLFGSMALVAEGLHMSTHAGALVIAALAYAYARRHARDERFAFGTGKMGDLAAFASAIVLAMIALLIGWESIGRFLHPLPIAFREAMPLAAVGLAVNLVSARLLHDPAGASHVRAHAHGHDHHHHDHAHGADHNLRAAYVHVLADAAVSLLALGGLGAAWALGWLWIDPAMGIVGMLVILNWAWSLLHTAGGVLLDLRPDAIAEEISARLETA